MSPESDNKSEEAAILLKKHQGKICERTRRQGSIITSEFDPDADPEAIETAVVYEATESAVLDTCHRLGCVVDPNVDEPTQGVCDLPKSPGDCGGAGVDSKSKLCDLHVPLADPEDIRPQRFMLTASVLFDIDAPESAIATDGAVGFLYQVALSKAKSSPLSSGGYLHHSLPHFYLHAAGFASLQRAGHDVGIVYKPGTALLTRYGIGVFGQYRGPSAVWNDGAYQIGPSLHVEIYHNILLRGAFLPYSTRPESGPTFMLSLEYAQGLLDDFR